MSSPTRCTAANAASIAETSSDPLPGRPRWPPTCRAAASTGCKICVSGLRSHIFDANANANHYHSSSYSYLMGPMRVLFCLLLASALADVPPRAAKEPKTGIRRRRPFSQPPRSSASRFSRTPRSRPAASMSCATCHDPDNAFAAPAGGPAVPLGGAELDVAGFRNAPSLKYLTQNPDVLLRRRRYTDRRIRSRRPRGHARPPGAPAVPLRARDGECVGRRRGRRS